MNVTSVLFSATTAKIGSLFVELTLLITQSELTVQNDANVFDIVLLEASTLNLHSRCDIPDQNDVKIINTTINTNAKCQFAPSTTQLINSQWNIEGEGQSPYAISTPITLINSTIKLTGVTLSVKSEIAMRNSSTIKSKAPIEITYNGKIGGEGTIEGDLVVKNSGRIQTSYSFERQYLFNQCLTILGTLSLDASSSIHLQQLAYITANSILLGDADIEISFSLRDWTVQEWNYTVIVSTQQSISGSFGDINVTVPSGYYRLVNSKSDVTMYWNLFFKEPQAPHTSHAPTQPPVENSVPFAGPNEPDPGVDSKLAIIIVESVMIGVGLILGGALLYRRFIKRRNYTEVSSFDRL